MGFLKCAYLDVKYHRGCGFGRAFENTRVQSLRFQVTARYFVRRCALRRAADIAVMDRIWCLPLFGALDFCKYMSKYVPNRSSRSEICKLSKVFVRPWLKRFLSRSLVSSQCKVRFNRLRPEKMHNYRNKVVCEVQFFFSQKMQWYAVYSDARARTITFTCNAIGLSTKYLLSSINSSLEDSGDRQKRFSDICSGSNTQSRKRSSEPYCWDHLWFHSVQGRQTFLRHIWEHWMRP